MKTNTILKMMMRTAVILKIYLIVIITGHHLRLSCWRSVSGLKTKRANLKTFSLQFTYLYSARSTLSRMNWSDRERQFQYPRRFLRMNVSHSAPGKLRYVTCVKQRALSLSSTASCQSLFYLWLSMVSANDRRCYIWSVFSHWLGHW